MAEIIGNNGYGGLNPFLNQVFPYQENRLNKQELNCLVSIPS